MTIKVGTLCEFVNCDPEVAGHFCTVVRGLEMRRAHNYRRTTVSTKLCYGVACPTLTVTESPPHCLRPIVPPADELNERQPEEIAA